MRFPACSSNGLMSLSHRYLAILASASERSQAVSALPIFLTHRLVPVRCLGPSGAHRMTFDTQVREHVATALYDRLLLDDSPEAEALVLETAWADNETAEAASSQLVSLLA